MKNIIIVVLLLGAFGVGGLYLKKRMDDKEKDDNAGTKVIDRKGKKGPANKPTPATKPATPATKTETPPAATAADAGTAAAPAAKKEEAKKEMPAAKKEEAKKEVPAPK